PDAGAARPGDDPDLGREDRPARGRRPVDAARLGGSGDRGGGGVGGLLVAEGTGAARLRTGCDRAVQRADGAVPPARRGEDHGSRARPGPSARLTETDLLRAMWRIRAFEERVG